MTFHLPFSKKILALAIFSLLFVVSLDAQPLKDSAAKREKADLLLHKSKSMRATGLVLMLGGTAATIGGFYGARDNYDLFTGEGSGYIVLWSIGISAMITGGVLFGKSFSLAKKAHILTGTDDLSRDMHLPLPGKSYRMGIAFQLP